MPTKITTRQRPRALKTLSQRLSRWLGQSLVEALEPRQLLSSPALTADTIQVTGAGQIISPGDTTPSTSDNTFFGFDGPDPAQITQSFTITNTGGATLDLGKITLPVGFTANDPIKTHLLPGESTALTITLSANTPGHFAGNVTIDSNDPDSPTYTFAIEGTRFDASPALNPTSDPTVLYPDGLMPAVTVDFRPNQPNSFTTAWVTSDGRSVMVQDKSGLQGQWSPAIKVSTSTDDLLSNPSVSLVDAETYVVVWSSLSGIFGRVFNNSGPLTEVFQVGSSAPGAIRATPGVATIRPETRGDKAVFVVTWTEITESGDSINSTLMAQELDSTGLATTQPTAIDSVTGGTIFNPQINLTYPDFYNVFYNVNQGSNNQVKVQQRSIGVVPNGDIQTLITGGYITDQAIAADIDTGTLFIVYESPTPLLSSQIFGQRFSANFDPVGQPMLLSNPFEGSASAPTVGFDFATRHILVTYAVQSPQSQSLSFIAATSINSSTGNIDDHKTVSVADFLFGGPVVAFDYRGVATVLWTTSAESTPTAPFTIYARTYSLTPQLTVTGNGQEIGSGLLGTSASNNTDFGWTGTGAGPITKTFTLTNNAGNPLTIGPITLPDGFKIQSAPTSILPGQSGDLVISFAGDKTGTSSGLVTIPTTGDDAPFSFNIHAEAKNNTLTFTAATPRAQRTLIDQHGNAVTFALTGAGAGTVTFDPQTKSILSLVLEGTRSNSNFAIDVAKINGQGTGYTDIQDITINSRLSAFTAAKVDLLQDFTAKEGLAAVTLHDIKGETQHTLNVYGSLSHRTDFTFNRISDLDLDTFGYIGRFTAVDWLDTNDQKDDLFAGAIDLLTITGQAKTPIAGDFEPDLHLFNQGRPSAASLGTARIAGSASNATWDIYGHTNSVTIGNAHDMEFNFENEIDSFTIKSAANKVDITAGSEWEAGFAGTRIGSLSIGQWVDGSVRANSIGTLTIPGPAKVGAVALPGKLQNVDILVQGYPPESAPAIGLIQVAGDVASVSLEAGGDINAIRIAGNADQIDFKTAAGLSSLAVSGIITDSNLTASEGIGSIRTAKWTNGSITAQSLGSLDVAGLAKTAKVDAVSGDFSAVLTLTGNPDKPRQNTLGAARIAGTVSGSYGHEIDWDITGSVGSIAAGALSVVEISLRPAQPALATKLNSFKAGSTNYWTLSAPGVQIGSITLAGANIANIYAAKIGSLTVTGAAKSASSPAVAGDFKGLIKIGENQSPIPGNRLGTLSIKGQAGALELDVFGNTGSITVGSGALLDADIHGNLSSFVSKGQVISHSQLTVEGALGSLSSVNWLQSDIQASKIGSINITGQSQTKSTPAIAGDFTGSLQLTGKNQGASATLLGSLTVAGQVADSQINSPGNVGSVRVNAFTNSTLFVGVAPEFPATGLPRHKASFSNPEAKLQSFSVVGAGAQANEPTFINGRVAAGQLLNVNIKIVGIQGDLITDTGFAAATRIGSYRRLRFVDGATVPVTVNNKTGVGLYDQQASFILSLIDQDNAPE